MAWDDFWQFVTDVGEPPGPRYTLARYRPNEPIGPRNAYWREPVSNVPAATREQRAARMREYNRRNPHRVKSSYLKKRYGITIKDYDRMMKEQLGCCAICGGVDESYALAVDHCHRSKKVRGLLCTNCNRGLGHFEDSPERLKAAAAYLRKHL